MHYSLDDKDVYAPSVSCFIKSYTALTDKYHYARQNVLTN